MSTETAAIETPANIPSTAGMTTKVIKGSMWTLAGQILPLFATLVTTPITIRLLGSERYGVLILVGLIPMYLAFADLGMGVASTRFGSAAYAQGDSRRESQIVWTAATIAFTTSLIFAVPLFVFSGYVIEVLRVPTTLQFEGTVALRIATAAFVINLLANVFNTPQLSRLRMDLNSLIGGGNRVLMSLAIPIALYLGGGIIGATVTGLVIAIFALAAHITVSGRLLRELFHASIDQTLVRPMLKFGVGLFISGIAAVVLGNIEKLALPRLVSIESLAFYSVAFTFANMATMYSLAMIQALVPAFSQLQEPDKRPELQALFSRSVRMNLIILLPAIMILFIIAKPFFTFWAGEAFGRESTPPFYILLLGLLFHLVAYVPHGVLTAAGRSDIFAKLYWIEAGLYVVLVGILVNMFRIEGAAMAWSLRVIVDALILVWLSKKVVGVEFNLRGLTGKLFVGLLILLPPVLFANFYNNFSPLLLILAPLFVLFYLFFIWTTVLLPEERVWFLQKIASLGRLTKPV